MSDLVVVTFKIPKDMLEELDSVARMEAVPRSEVIRQAIAEYLRKRVRPAPYKVVKLTS